MPTHAEYQSFKGQPVAAAAPASDFGRPPTTPDILGPKYKPGAPFRESFLLHPTLTVSGEVLDTASRPIVGAVLDVWQADEQGAYDDAGFELRGKVRTDRDGIYVFHTVKPGHYQIGPDEYRPGHLHFKVSADGFKPLTTQLYFPDDPHNDSDHWFDARRVVTELGTGKCEFTFVLAAEAAEGKVA